MMGAAWATTLSYGVCAAYIIYFFLSKNTSLHPTLSAFNLKPLLIKEISSLGSVTLARQAMVSVTVLLVNNILFSYGGESSIAVYAIISRMLMFATFPILGITQGFLPIAGYNYGSKNIQRVRSVINISIRYAVFLATLIFLFIFFFAEYIPGIFSKDSAVAAPNSISIKICFRGFTCSWYTTNWCCLFSSYRKGITCLVIDTKSSRAIFYSFIVYSF